MRLIWDIEIEFWGRAGYTARATLLRTGAVELDTPATVIGVADSDDYATYGPTAEAAEARLSAYLGMTVVKRAAA